MNSAEIIAAKTKAAFPLMDFDDLKCQADLEFLEHASLDPPHAYVCVKYRVKDYAIAETGSLLRSRSDALDWVTVSMDSATVGILLEDMRYSLTPDAQYIIGELLSGGFTFHKRPTMRQIRLVLMDRGWRERKAREVLNEIKDFWRGYV